MAKAAKTIKVEQTGSAIRRHHSQRSTLIDVAFAAVLIHTSWILRRLSALADNIAGVAGTLPGTATVATFEGPELPVKPIARTR